MGRKAIFPAHVLFSNRHTVAVSSHDRRLTVAFHSEIREQTERTENGELREENGDQGKALIIT
jgi:hypothetical protein